MATNGCFGHSGQSEVSEDIHIGFPMHNNMGIDTKIKSLAKLTNLAILAYFSVANMEGQGGNRAKRG